MSDAERAGETRQDKSTRQDSSVSDGAGTGAESSAGAEASRGAEGRLLAGRYRLGDVLGRGGMGTVWRAKDETLGRTVAVKELRFPTSIDEEEKRRLVTRTLREAKAIARIRNNGAVTVFDVVDEDDRPWIVMELVEGKSLAEAVREDGLLEPRRAAEVGLAILDVLRSAHREGILHRDVKPSNVLIAEDGRVVLTDFGIAQVEGDPSITSTGMLVGAPSYISPERARGHKPGPAADMWSLGGLLYAAVEGVPPYDKGSAIATLTAVMTEPVDPPTNAGPLAPVIYGLLAKDPAQRLDDAGARALLNDVIHAPEPKAAPEPEPVEATKVVPLPPLPPEYKRRSEKAGSAAAGVAAKSGEAAERLRGALTSVRKAAATAVAERSASPAPGAPAKKAAITDVVPRRTLVIAAVVAALVVVGTVLAFALSGGDDQGGKAGGDRTAPSAGATAGDDDAKGDDKGDKSGKDDGKSDEGKGAGGDPSSSASRSASASASPSDDSSGKGSGSAAETTYKHSQGFKIGLPKGWKYVSTSAAGARFTGPEGQKLLVGWTTTPKSDPVADWKNQERYMQRSNYHRIRIAGVDYRGWNTADWEFTYTDGGTKYRSVDRGFVVNGSLGYGLMYTAKDGDWDGALRKSTWKTFTQSFTPKS
ncbi:MULTISPECIES: serine/threonine-protein kinase [unclassified Streptomyces]|uniref:serine/threonine-protein kinase n=1 Tax=unclassified Streptomyces TaxID=2593676 RepID=UPI000DB90E27|nr:MULTISPECIES: serine/threonine-protein kinase [unclassified Streptomyces]MYT68571.1 protein kinase [Streptomyces sp. SID8367]RAJ86243.1 serine/threonine protein kinase [Streptomyces sp. PsTaAH-137]